ncbi:hypothetical protein [Dactylosporangium sp. CA-092794]|uniref:hypothetical protein n=1 Tax=Dactylosporangium sp. CA-092794 TaxID=3239929 RepID=UPI003D8C6A72
MTDTEAHAEAGRGGLSRRQVLTAAGVVIGAGAIELAPPSPASAKAPDLSPPVLTLEPIADDPVTVLSGDSTTVAAYPRQLAVRIVNTGADLPAGTSIEISFDPRLYSPRRSALITAGTRRVRTTSAVRRDKATGMTVCAVTLGEPIPASPDTQHAPVLVAGTAHPAPYPQDLLRNTADPVIEVPAAGRSPRVEQRLRASRAPGAATPRTPWGVELTGGWGRHVAPSAAEFVYYYPQLLRVSGTGPGDAPTPLAFTVALDPYLVKELTTTSVLLNGKPPAGRIRLVRTVRTTSVYETQWATPVKVKAGDVLEIGLQARLLTPPTTLPAIKHPVVVIGGAGADPSQRQTGRHTMTRLDSTWGPISG